MRKTNTPGFAEAPDQEWSRPVLAGPESADTVTRHVIPRTTDD